MKNKNDKKTQTAVTQKYMDEMMRMYRDRTPTENTSRVTPPTTIPPDPMDEVPSVQEELPDLPEENYGTLILEVTTARGDIPLSDAHITVFTQDDGKRNIIAFLTTDKSGRSNSLALEAPPRNLSLSPDSDGKPYASYSTYTTMNGFYPVVNNNIPVFSGVKSIQQVNMIPLPEFQLYPDRDIVFNENEPQDLE